MLRRFLTTYPMPQVLLTSLGLAFIAGGMSTYDYLLQRYALYTRNNDVVANMDGLKTGCHQCLRRLQVLPDIFPCWLPWLHREKMPRVARCLPHDSRPPSRHCTCRRHYSQQSGRHPDPVTCLQSWLRAMPGSFKPTPFVLACPKMKANCETHAPKPGVSTSTM